MVAVAGRLLVADLGVIKASPAQRYLVELPGSLVQASAGHCLVRPHYDQN